MKKYRVAAAFVLTLSLALFLTDAFAAEPVTDALPKVRVLPSSLALEIAQRTVAACTAKGWSVSAVIVDPAGVMRTMVSSDGVRAISIDAARRKAVTAVLTNSRTSALAKVTSAAPPYADLLTKFEPSMLFLGGGMPIVVAGDLVGAIGVGGAPHGPEGVENDEECALIALNAVSARLK